MVSSFYNPSCYLPALEGAPLDLNADEDGDDGDDEPHEREGKDEPQPLTIADAADGQYGHHHAGGGSDRVDDAFT